ncbi:rhodanese-like domain-containing protein [Alteraurantiacibacter aquimixticola]|uniref:Rhodanese-like domain-containing protein n=1 Tax=Alteraurantiacibacter aquimixticola TaxID=2489173 RepID=A0A4T3F1N8_9SPHN|nr:rhodanese-like domain-containing protein [Alteraurantiacibacter aquimixticola]TIX51076.1 rhodanese-like domain-containing protein [Alteraurantiacibacter aquimixticola]
MRRAVLLCLPLALAACSVEEEEIAPGAVAEEASVAAVETISAVDLAAMLKAGEAILVDVRTPEEFAEMRLAGALNAPLSTFDPASIPMEVGRTTILMCRSSRRSGEAATKLAEHIGGTVRHLEGGILAWEEAGLETLAEPRPAS